MKGECILHMKWAVGGARHNYHMVEEHSKAPYLDIITIRLMLDPGSKKNSNRGTIEENIRVRKGLNLLKIRCCISC